MSYPPPNDEVTFMKNLSLLESIQDMKQTECLLNNELLIKTIYTATNEHTIDTYQNIFHDIFNFCWQETLPYLTISMPDKKFFQNEEIILTLNNPTIKELLFKNCLFCALQTFAYLEQSDSYSPLSDTIKNLLNCTLESSVITKLKRILHAIEFDSLYLNSFILIKKAEEQLPKQKSKISKMVICNFCKELSLDLLLNNQKNGMGLLGSHKPFPLARLLNHIDEYSEKLFALGDTLGNSKCIEPNKTINNHTKEQLQRQLSLLKKYFHFEKQIEEQILNVQKILEKKNSFTKSEIQSFMKLATDIQKVRSKRLDKAHNKIRNFFLDWYDDLSNVKENWHWNKKELLKTKNTFINYLIYQYNKEMIFHCDTILGFINASTFTSQKLLRVNLGDNNREPNFIYYESHTEWIEQLQKLSTIPITCNLKEIVSLLPDNTLESSPHFIVALTLLFQSFCISCWNYYDNDISTVFEKLSDYLWQRSNTLYEDTVINQPKHNILYTLENTNLIDFGKILQTIYKPKKIFKSNIHYCLNNYGNGNTPLTTISTELSMPNFKERHINTLTQDNEEHIYRLKHSIAMDYFLSIQFPSSASNVNHEEAQTI